MLKHCREFENEDALYDVFDDAYNSSQEDFNALFPMLPYLEDEDQLRFYGVIRTMTINSETNFSDLRIDYPDSYCLWDSVTDSQIYFQEGGSIYLEFQQTWNYRWQAYEEIPEDKSVTVFVNNEDVTSNVFTMIRNQEYVPHNSLQEYTYKRNVYKINIPMCTKDVIVYYGTEPEELNSGEDDNTGGSSNLPKETSEINPGIIGDNSGNSGRITP